MRGTGMLLSTVVLILTLAATTAVAAPSPEVRCAAAKLRATGGEARARLLCERRALTSSVLEPCGAAAIARRGAAYARADASGACASTHDSDILGAALDDLLVSLRLELVPGGFQPSRCTAAKLLGTGRAIGEMVAAHARDVRAPDPSRLAADLVAARVRLAAAFARAVRAGDCLSDASATEIGTLLVQAAATFRNLLAGSCPCWTTAQLDAAFPPGFFDAAGRGGATCSVPAPDAIVNVSASDTCTLFGPAGMTFVFPRGGAAIVNATTCFFTGDLDPSDSGTCGGAPSVTTVTAAEAAVCAARLRTSEPYRSSCP